MRTYTKISIFTAALLISHISAQASEQSDDIISTNNTQKDGASVIRFANNGVIYITEDSNIGSVVLNVAASPYVSFSDGAITESVEFYIKTNYAAFIEKMEIDIYRAEDIDLIEPVAKVSVPSGSFNHISWDGKLSDKYTYRTKNDLVYVLRAYGKDGKFDETAPGTIQLLKSNDVNSSKSNLQDAIFKEHGIYLSIDDAWRQRMLDRAFNNNSLSKQNIVINGSKVIIRGSNIPEGELFINNEQYPLDLERKFISEYIVPAGTYYYDIRLNGQKSISEKLKIDISKHHFFGMAIADFTIGKEHSKDSNLAEDSDNYDILRDGRLAFYLKSKVYSKYQITAQADTTQKDVKKLFNGFTQADAIDLFESLDPDMYYPTYGDDSTVIRDINTQGRFYFRTDWDKSQVIWGNYDTGFGETQYGAYSRSLYGAKLDYKSIDINKWGDSKITAKAFGSQMGSAAGHTELVGTGGSLYYLKHTNILPGSDKILLQVTDKTTGNIITKISLARGVDYEIDNTQGRIILSRPLSQIFYQGLNSIASQTLLNGYEQLLIADYEFVPSGFEGDLITSGVRVKHWFGDHIAVGGTYVKEEKAGDDYEIIGGDITLQAGKGTYVKAEFTNTKSKAAPIYYSTNGGLSFTELGSTFSSLSGEAKAVNVGINFKELGLSDKEINFGAWWRDVDKGYSNAHSTAYALNDVTEYGFEFLGQITENLKAYTKANKAQNGAASHTQEQLTTEYRFNDIFSLSAEIQNLQINNGNATLEGTLGALRVNYNINPNLETFVTGQVTLYDDNGAYENNDAVIFGARYLYGDGSSASAKYTAGYRGDALELDISYRLSKDHTVYSGYTWVNSYVSDFDTAFGLKTNNGFTIGQKWNLTNKISLYNESQYIKDNANKGVANSLGMDFYVGEGWNAGFLYQKGGLDGDKGYMDRNAFSVNLGRTSNKINWASKLEYRQDQGAEEREQWLTTNRLSFKIDDSLSFAGRVNYSNTKDYLSSQNGAKFTELNLGFAYRPYNSTKWAFFGRYTYLYDLSTLGQNTLNETSYDQKSQVLSFESVYKFDAKWEFALKYATRIGKARYTRGEGSWFDSTTLFYAGQVRYDILYKWHGLFEYRALNVKDGGTKSGYLVGVDRDITKNFRVGIGYNFTNFSDDLTKLDYGYKGWFLNFLGTY
jgi:hypothetical protein